ncbi:WYL domain-containing protein [Clostridium thermobutyricum]|uniref:helix-turn-helix transcriptional regulator n=1 Tax=Clostridium thermobutyricum TaxID=29372 RepID=UPI002943F78F|nr:WYL domain-containing protein [Clostridium thermobutyricum]
MKKKEGKNRILTIYNMLINNKEIDKSKIAMEFKVNEKTIRRDIDEIKNFFYENIDEFGEINIEYDRKKSGYILKGLNSKYDEKEVLVLIKILLGSRGLCKKEVNCIIEKLVYKLDDKEKGIVKELIGNELRNYVSPRHNKELILMIWDIEQAIRNHRKIKINYKKVNGVEQEVEILPKGIIYSEYYFYLIADKELSKDRVYRIDRISSYKMLEKTFPIRELQSFQEGEFRKTVQFMQKDDLIRTKFEFIGESVEALLDRVPTAKIIKEEKGRFILEAKVYKRGIKMWFLSQGRNIRVIEPKELIEEIREEIKEMSLLY